MKQRFKRRLALLLAGGMLLALLSGCGDRGSDGAPLPDESAPTEIVTDSGETLTVTEPTPADSYGTLYQALTGVQQAVNDIYEISEMASIPEEQLVNPEAEEFGDPDYAKANIPAESLTEGDLIVTDGSYIYMICASELVIVAASGESTAEVGRIFVTNPPRRDTAEARRRRNSLSAAIISTSSPTSISISPASLMEARPPRKRYMSNSMTFPIKLNLSLSPILHRAAAIWTPMCRAMSFI